MAFKISKVIPGASQGASRGRSQKGTTRIDSITTVDVFELDLQTASPPAQSELERDIARLFINPKLWLDTPHPELGGHKPSEFLEDGRQQPLRELIAAIKYGLFA